MFIVPKYLVDDNGNIGVANDLKCISLEHKLGIHASPTCVLQFGDNGGARGYLVGDENSGMRYMFTMMNQARLAVGLEGLAVADRAYQQAIEYALERRQGRRSDTPKGESSLILEHPDVRRMLMTMKAYIEAMRCLIYLNAKAIDIAHNHPDETERQAGVELTDLLTPLSKGWCTDLGNELTSIGIQIHGGMGFVEETGAAQHLRDSRISPIYEGTNGIQAIDLVGRKLKMNEGKVIRDLLDEIKDFTESLNQQGEEFETITSNLTDSLQAVEEATAWLAEKGTGDPIQAISGATPYLRMLGQLVGGWFLARLAIGARSNENVGDADFRNSKMTVANFYAEQLLPLTRAQLGAVTAGSSDLFAVPEELFST